MAEPSPTEPPEGQEPEELEGQKPAVAAEPATEPEPPEAKTYPESYVRQLRAESGNYRKRLAELEEKLQDIEDADKSESERLTKRLTAAEQRAQDAETGLLRYQVAAERGLDSRAASFLTGSTREEMELRAEELAGLLAEQTPGTTRSASFDGGARVPAPQAGPPEEEHNDFLMRALGRAPNR
jgi:hypothetical protein